MTDSRSERALDAGQPDRAMHTIVRTFEDFERCSVVPSASTARAGSGSRPRTVRPLWSDDIRQAKTQPECSEDLKWY